jgi:2-polyprenyl-3-methyl-5-hydroxy-6-metoxy-1,4-benzoquinol methylase
VDDLGLNNLFDKNIADVGCGLGFIYNRLVPEIKKNYYGFDGAEIESVPFNYTKVDLDNFNIKKPKFFDAVFCFETIEHLTNPYNCLLEIKNILKYDHLLYITIPNYKTEHNTIYPSLLYPVDNFIKFLQQMAFEIQDHRIHDKCFYQEVFILKNKDWSNSKMLWPKYDEKFKNIPPHISINL